MNEEQIPQTMNEKDEISTGTRLFGLMGEHAQRNRLFVLMNKRIKESGLNGMMIPMNIREDDFYFTLSNMRNSHVNGTWIDREYQEVAVELLDSETEIVRRSGRCDLAVRHTQTLHGDFITPWAVKSLMEQRLATKIAVVGSGSLARALAIALEGKEVAFFDSHVEDLLVMAKALEMDLDINRLDNDMVKDLSQFDVLIDTDESDLYGNVTALPRFCLDLMDEQGSSSLQRCAVRLDDVEYLDHTSLLPVISEIIFTTYIED